MSASKKALAVLTLAAGVGLAYGLAGLHDPPGQEECSLVTVLVLTDAGRALETIDVCGSADGGVATGKEFIREISHGPKRQRNGKAIGLHRQQASGCTCSTGINCERLVHNLDGNTTWAVASLGTVMQENEWRGTGCLAIPSCYDVNELPLGSNLVPGCLPVVDAGTPE